MVTVLMSFRWWVPSSLEGCCGSSVLPGGSHLGHVFCSRAMWCWSWCQCAQHHREITLRKILVRIVQFCEELWHRKNWLIPIIQSWASLIKKPMDLLCISLRSLTDRCHCFSVDCGIAAPFQCFLILRWISLYSITVLLSKPATGLHHCSK